MLTTIKLVYPRDYGPSDVTEAVLLPAGTYIGSTGLRGLRYLNKTVDVAMAGQGDKIHCTLLGDGAEHVIDS